MNVDKSMSRAATLDDLKRVLRAFAENHVQYLLIGGFALNAHGYTRATTDIDVVIPNDVENAKNIKIALLVLSDQIINDVPLEWFNEGETIRVADEVTVDLLFNAAGWSYGALEKYAQTVMLDDVEVRTINLEGLLLTKKTMREKDKIDRFTLELALQDARDQRDN